MTAFKAALLGRELSHSISDALHREIFPLVGPKAPDGAATLQYDLVECLDEASVSFWLKTAASSGYFGANVTYPYKPQLFRSAAMHVGAAASIGSANAVRFTGALAECGSTDGAGFLSALLREYPQFDLEPYHLVIVGDGATAKAVTFALCTKWMPLSLTIVSRTASSAKALAEFAVAEAPGPSVATMSINDAVNHFPESRHRLVIQATPVGQRNHPGNLLAGFAWTDRDMAIDLVYNPTQTPILTAAASAGARTMNGLGMLIEQAALSQVFWQNGMIPAMSPLTNDEYRSLKEKFTKHLAD